MATIGTTSDNDWQRMTATDNEGKWVVVSANFFFFREEPSNKHPKENPLNLEEDREEDLLN